MGLRVQWGKWGQMELVKEGEGRGAEVVKQRREITIPFYIDRSTCSGSADRAYSVALHCLPLFRFRQIPFSPQGHASGLSVAAVIGLY